MMTAVRVCCDMVFGVRALTGSPDVAASQNDKSLTELGELRKELIREWRVRQPGTRDVRVTVVRPSPESERPYDADIIAYVSADNIDAELESFFIDEINEIVVSSPDSNDISEGDKTLKGLSSLVGKLEDQWARVRLLNLQLGESLKQRSEASNVTQSLLRRADASSDKTRRVLELSKKARSGIG